MPSFSLAPTTATDAGDSMRARFSGCTGPDCRPTRPRDRVSIRCRLDRSIDTCSDPGVDRGRPGGLLELDEIAYHQSDGVVEIVLDRPEKLNAISARAGGTRDQILEV